MTKEEDWGRRKLAYEVKKRREGRYVLMEYLVESTEVPHELERRLRINEQVIKFLTVRIDDDKKRLSWEKKQAIKAEAEAARRAAEQETLGESGAAAEGKPAEKTDAAAPAEKTDAAAPAEKTEPASDQKEG